MGFDSMWFQSLRGIKSYNKWNFVLIRFISVDDKAHGLMNVQNNVDLNEWLLYQLKNSEYYQF